MGARLMAIVAEGDRGRVYLPPTPEHGGHCRDGEADVEARDVEFLPTCARHSASATTG